ncbi:MAG: COX15/CtaA family protein [Acidobacteria bacterium]|nr:COX15/CtaA family protein [Acidobacteriota bacterium]
MDHLWLHRYAILLAVCTLLLVVAGASVTSNDAGLSVPDWPLSYGKVMPPMTGGIFYEHGHRMVATAVGFMTIVLAVWLWRADSRRWMKRLGLAALGGVILQGVLGGLTVLFLLPRGVSIAHASLAQLFFSTTVAIALFTSPGWKRGPRMVEDGGRPPLRKLAVIVPLAILGQLALGAAYRHKLLGLMPHIVGAMVVGGIVLMVAMFVLTQFAAHRPLKKAAHSLAGLTFVQVFLGIAAYMSRITYIETARPEPVMVLFTVLHVAAGATVLAASVVLAIQVLRNVRTIRPS